MLSRFPPGTDEARPEGLRGRTEVAHRAFARGIVVRLLGMAGDAQRAIGNAPGHGGRCVAGGASEVSVRRRRMRGSELGAVAGVARRTAPLAGVVVVVTGGACRGLRVGSERDRRRVAGHALQLAVL